MPADRKGSGHARLGRLLYGRDPTPSDRVGHDAADEIERLRRVVDELDAIRDEVLHDGPDPWAPNDVLMLIDRATSAGEEG